MKIVAGADQKYRVGNFDLTFPADHRLRQIHAIHTLYDRGFSDLVETISAADPNASFIDIGANVGDTAAYFRSHARNPILAVEGSPNFQRYLCENIKLLGPGVEIESSFASVRQMETASVSFVEGTGSGHLKRAASATDVPLVPVAQLLERARSIGNGVCSLLKTDTDGLDAYIIESALDAGFRGVLFFECDLRSTIDLDDPDIWRRIYARFDELGYSAIVYENLGLPLICMDKFSAGQMFDLHGNLRLQHDVKCVRSHYHDVWAFPPEWHKQYIEARDKLRAGMLRLK
ncbi:MAG: FkbM family methyltransferase [Hyphomicrobium sp.]